MSIIVLVIVAIFIAIYSYNYNRQKQLADFQKSWPKYAAIGYKLADLKSQLGYTLPFKPQLTNGVVQPYLTVTIDNSHTLLSMLKLVEDKTIDWSAISNIPSTGLPSEQVQQINNLNSTATKLQNTQALLKPYFNYFSDVDKVIIQTDSGRGDAKLADYEANIDSQLAMIAVPAGLIDFSKDITTDLNNFMDYKNKFDFDTKTLNLLAGQNNLAAVSLSNYIKSDLASQVKPTYLTTKYDLANIIAAKDSESADIISAIGNLQSQFISINNYLSTLIKIN